ncbi:MAG: hypothetical protein IT494_00160 [Gammaproteobacteria bacterium]|nr:hypothetical protein [Gammaproteobacteria bacterium]
MTLSLKSGFSSDGRRALLLTADRATVYQWRGGEIAAGFVFGADEHGLEQFGRYLSQTANEPLYVLADLVEEEYRQDSIPHVRGADRRAVLQRKQARLFRGTSYCHALVQGREPEGRRDDRVLLTALVKPELVAPWIEQIAAHRIALAGILSLPILSGQLLPAIGAGGANVLLVTLHGSGGLRQTFFRDRQFKLSRLVPLPRSGTTPIGGYLLGELDKLRRYLSSLGLLAANVPLQIYILAHGDWLEAIASRCRDTEDERYLLVDVADVGRKLGVSGALTTPYCDLLFAQVLLAKPPRNHYARREQMRYFSLYRARVGLFAASIAVLLAGAGWGGFGLLEGLSYQRQAVMARQQADYYQARNEVARRGLPPTPAEPRDIRAAVDLVAELRRSKVTPLPLLRTLSAALEGNDAIDLDRIDWRGSADATARADRVPSASGSPCGAASGAGIVCQTAEVTGRVNGFAGDPRGTSLQVDRFAAALRAAPRVRAVTITRWPVDTRPSANLSGEVAPTAAGAPSTFTLQVVFEHGNDAG